MNRKVYDSRENTISEKPKLKSHLRYGPILLSLLKQWHTPIGHFNLQFPIFMQKFHTYNSYLTC